MGNDAGYRMAPQGRSCAFCNVVLDPESARLSPTTGEYACAQCLAVEQIRIGDARARSAGAGQLSAGGRGGRLVGAVVLMVTMPLVGAFIGTLLPVPSRDYGGSLASLLYAVAGFLCGGACSLVLLVVTIVRSRSNRAPRNVENSRVLR